MGQTNWGWGGGGGGISLNVVLHFLRQSELTLPSSYQEPFPSFHLLVSFLFHYIVQTTFEKQSILLYYKNACFHRQRSWVQIRVTQVKHSSESFIQYKIYWTDIAQQLPRTLSIFSLSLSLFFFPVTWCNTGKWVRKTARLIVVGSSSTMEQIVIGFDVCTCCVNTKSNEFVDLFFAVLRFREWRQLQINWLGPYSEVPLI